MIETTTYGGEHTLIILNHRRRHTIQIRAIAQLAAHITPPADQLPTAEAGATVIVSCTDKHSSLWDALNGGRGETTLLRTMAKLAAAVLSPAVDGAVGEERTHMAAGYVNGLHAPC